MLAGGARRIFGRAFGTAQRAMASTASLPKYLLLHVDINETIIAGDGAKGYDGHDTLKLAASKYITTPEGQTFYKSIESLHKGKPKHDIEMEVFKAMDHATDNKATTDTIKSKADLFAAGCTKVNIGNGKSMMVLSTFLNMLESLQSNESVEKCLIVFRTYGPDMGDIMNAMKAINLLDESQWKGYGELVYTRNEGGNPLVVNNYTKPDQDSSKLLLDLAKANLPSFTPSVVYNAAWNPATTNLKEEFSQQKGMSFDDLLVKILHPILETPSPHKIQFAGIREVFGVWQRYNRNHAKIHYFNPKASGANPTEPVSIFLDDNAYEEEDKGKPGPYIVTPYQLMDGNTYTVAALDARYECIIRPDKEKAYTVPAYYQQLIEDACAK